LRAIDCEVLLPVHNEAQSIEATIRALHAEFQKVARVAFIICEDGSKDNSKEILRRLASEIPMRLNLSDERKGYSRAVREGMAMLEADYLLCIDSDGQCDPADFRKLWEKRKTSDLIIGRRTKRADTFVRKFCSRLFYGIYQTAFGVPVHDPSCPFVLIPKMVANQLGPELGMMKEGFWWEFVACAHLRGFTMTEIPINHQLRSAGKTQVYRWQKMPGIFLRHVAGIWMIKKRMAPRHGHSVHSDGK
jgi:dolichol-phosphate mannosyltransferase